MKFDRSGPGIETYPVGLFMDFRYLWRDCRHIYKRQGRAHPMTYRLAVKRFVRSFQRSWRRRSYWNGYLAEWHYCPAGVDHSRAGRGWTRRAALRRLGAHIVASNLLVATSMDVAP